MEKCTPASSAAGTAIADSTAGALDLDTAENTIMLRPKPPSSTLALSDFLLPELVSLRLCAQRTVTDAAARG